MQRKIISIPTNNNLIYRQILASLNFLLDLTHQERDVLAEIIKLNNKYKSLAVEDRARFIFCTEMRNDMCEKLSLKKSQLANITTRLRKKSLSGVPLIDEDNMLNPYLLIEPDSDGFRLEINLVNTNLISEVKPEVIEQIQETSELVNEFLEEISEEVKEEIKNSEDMDNIEEMPTLVGEITLLPPEDD